MNSITAFFNQFSFVLMVATALLALVAVMRWRRAARGQIMGVVLVIGILTGVVWSALRPGGNSVASVEEARAQIAAGKPVLIEFFSNY
jgi:cbb3-type cytochrome oxidase subunit 3